jgi:hypothetical protein
MAQVSAIALPDAGLICSPCQAIKLRYSAEMLAAGAVACVVSIVSAGKGLLTEDKLTSADATGMGGALDCT